MLYVQFTMPQQSKAPSDSWSTGVQLHTPACGQSGSVRHTAGKFESFYLLPTGPQQTTISMINGAEPLESSRKIRPSANLS